MKIIYNIAIIFLVIILIPLNIFADDLFGLLKYDASSLIFSYDIVNDGSAQYYTTYTAEYDEQLDEYIGKIIKIPYMSFSIYYLFHKDIFIYGLNSHIILKLPISDHYKIFTGSMNIMFGFESNNPKSAFIFQSGISLGLYYQYFSIPEVAYYDYINDSYSIEDFYDSSFSILFNFFFTVGIKINKNLNVKFILYYTNSILDLDTNYFEPYICLAFEWFLPV